MISCKNGAETPSNTTVPESAEVFLPELNNQDKNNIEVVEKPNSDTNIELQLPGFKSRKLTDLEKQPIQTIMEQAKSFTYPDEPFVPLLLLDNQLLLGELTRNDGAVIAALNLTTGEYFDLIVLEKSDETRFTKLVAGNSQYLLYAHYWVNQEKLTYYLYDFASSSIQKIHHVNDVPNLHYSSAVFLNNDLFFMSFHGKSEPYNIFHYDINSQRLTTISNKHAIFPVTIGNDLFYLRVDYQNHITKIIQKTGESNTVWLQEQGRDLFLSGLASNNQISVLTRTNNDKVELFTFDPDNRQVQYLFDTLAVENLVVGPQMISWTGAQTVPNRTRLQYHLFDYQNDIFYENNGGSVFLNNDSLVWIEYLKEEKDIMKGEVFRNENSRIRYLDLGSLRK